jgi:hypothetical protein
VRIAGHRPSTVTTSDAEAAHIRPHYEPLIGAAAADDQVRRWWNGAHIGAAVAEGLVVVADAEGQLAGVGQRGRGGADHVVYKLYVDPGIAAAGWVHS